MAFGFAPWGSVPWGVLPDSAVADQGLSTLRYATTDWHSDPVDTPASTTWRAGILGDVTVAVDGTAALSGGLSVSATVGTVELWDPDGGLAGPLEDLGLAAGRAAQLRVVPVLDPRASDLGTPLRDAQPFFTGTVRAVRRGTDRRATLELDDATLALDTPLQASRYAGTGGLEGPETLADRPRPVLLGQVWSLAPIALGNVDLGDGALPTYQYHWRAAAGVDAVRIRGVAQDLVGTTPGVGEARDHPTLGVFQLGASPDGEVTCGARGDAFGGVYPDSTAGILWRLISGMGPQLGEAARDAASWQFADADLPGVVGWYSNGGDPTALAACNEILAGSRALLAGGRDGRLRLVDPFTTASTVQFDLSAPMILAEPVPVPLPADLSPTPAEVLVEWGRNWAPVSSIAGVVEEAERQRLADAAAPVARWGSAVVEARVARRRVLRLPGLYHAAADAQARAEVIGGALLAGRSLRRVTTDRYLGQIDAGTLGRVTFPGAGLQSGLFGVVLGWSEAAAGRRQELVIFGGGA
ncbi:hypothetical protein [Falsiroseomonas selenitidurans]|uniref:Uncharacterized protein n=1 Tax=Falsiroseomonas selenitidurans TaxID=2716335 RepID=A0ABX1ECL5_9PROT|nr:hypothetical protein [Falsiroseomonas selenitidurans]NKC33503.1 hypothetical protein [Falsiroseomonas selenitidurans]